MTNKNRLNVLYFKKIENKSNAEIAQELNIHRNSVRNICNKYNLSNDLIIRLKHQLENNEISECKLCDYFPYTPRQRKITDIDIKEIEECCKNHLNCYLSPEELCVELAKQKFVDKKYIIHYNSFNIENTHIFEGDYDWHMRRKYLRKIREIRSIISPPKNYDDVYHWYYKKTESYFRNNISYSGFYGYAKKYWYDNAQEFWQFIRSKNLTFGEYLDKYFYYDDNDKKIKNRVK